MFRDCAVTFWGVEMKVRVKLDLTGAEGEAEGMTVGREGSGSAVRVRVGGVGSVGAVEAVA